MKKQYVEPTIEIVELEEKDIIVMSDTVDVPFDDLIN